MTEIVRRLQKLGLIGNSAEFNITTLTGGYWNSVHRVRGKDVDWVVKSLRPNKHTTLFPILPASEAAALKHLRGQKLAPELIRYQPAIDDQPALIVYQFIHGEWWQDDVAGLAEALYRLHQLPLDDDVAWRRLPIAATSTGFDPTETILQQADILLAACKPSPQVQRVVGLKPSPQTTPPLPRWMLIHTDVGPGNIIQGRDGIRLIDWQSPGVGDSAEDLCSFLSPAMHILYHRQPLDGAAQAKFLTAYPDAATVERAQALRPFFDYRMACHCALQSQWFQTTNPSGAATFARALEAMMSHLSL